MIVLIFDHRGMGGSTLPDADPYKWQLTDLAEDVHDLVKHVGWSEIDLLGFSMVSLACSRSSSARCY